MAFSSVGLAQSPAGSATAPSPAKGARQPSAQPAAKSPPPVQVKRARELWYKGVEAFRNGDYEGARLAFTECYQLMPKSDVLRNLSISELQSGHYVLAARHLRQLLAAPGDLPENVQEEARSRLAQAEAQIGQFAISVDVAGADVTIDGESIGRSPLKETWYVEAGEHRVGIGKAGYPSEQRHVFALAGVTIPIAVSLDDLRREQAREAEAARLMGTHEGQDDSRGFLRNLSTTSAVVLIGTSAVALGALGSGIWFTVEANDHGENADRLQRLLPADTRACNRKTAFAADCDAFHHAQNEEQSDRQAAILSFIGFGVASGAALGYALWLNWGDEERSAKPSLVPSAVVGRGGMKLGVSGTF